MASTSLDLSQIKTDALSAASTFRTLIGLGNVNNTSDANKPISSATQSALDGKLSLTGGTLTGGLSGTSATFSSTVTIPTITGSGNLIYVAQNQTFSWEYDTTNTNPALRFTWGGAATTLWGSSSAINISIQGVNGFRVAAGQTNIASTLGIGSVSSPTLFLRSDSSNTLDIRNSTNAQRFNLYGTYTDASNYRRLYLSSTTAGAFTIGVEGAGTGASGNTLAVNNALTANVSVTAQKDGGFILSDGVGHFKYDFAGGGANSSTEIFGAYILKLRCGGLRISPMNYGGSKHVILDVSAAAFTDITASEEATDVNFNLARTVQFAAGNITTQRAFRIEAPTYSFASASTITTASTVYISGAPSAGTNATITNRYALMVDGDSNTGQVFFNGPIGIGGQSPRASNSHPLNLPTYSWINFGNNPLIGWQGDGLSFNSNYLKNAAGIILSNTQTFSLLSATLSCKFELYNTSTDASNYIRQSLSFTTYSSTVHAQHVVEGAGTGAVNVPFVITPRGTGAFILGPMPDGTSVGGNARGAYAVDLQTSRSAATQVASDFGVAIGTQCTVSGGTGSVAIGRNVNVSDSLGGAVGIGRNVTVTGYRSIGIGSGATTGADSVAIGTGAAANNYAATCIGPGTVSRWDGFVSWHANNLINASPPQYNNTISGAGVQNAIKIFRTVNNTPALIESSIVTSFVGSRSRHKGALIFAKAVVVAIRSDGAVNKYERRVAIKDLASVDGSTSTMSVLSSETIGTDILEMPHLNIAITAVSKSLRITVTGEQEYAVTGNSTTDVITATGHPFVNDDIVVFNSLTGGSGLTTNPNGQYYFGIYKVINVSGDTFQLAATGSGSTPINFTTDITAGAICRPILWYTNPIEFFVAAGAY